MKLGSFYYLAFLSAVVLLYYLIGARYRWALVLSVSYLFYASWKPAALLVLAGTTIVNYFAAGAMGRRDIKAERRKLLLLALAADLGLLFIFKYFGFVSGALQGLLREAGVLVKSPALDIVMPIGLSFYTLQTIGYILDVYHGRAKPERHWGTFAVYVSFFPIVLSGPIERANHLLPQLQRRARIALTYENISRGAKTIILGLFYKLVVADRAAVYVNAVFGHSDKHSGLTFIAATIFYSFQIYGDFAGYSLVAIGSARMLGIEILQNFNRPYFAGSIKDFWRRWHISLSTWLRDYVFLPLAFSFSRALKKERYLRLRADRIIYVAAIFLTFLLCGLWHGANWTFVAWGGLHGVYLAGDNMFRWKARRRIWSIGLTYILVLFSWVFFRAASMAEALAVIGKMLTRPGSLYLPQGADIVAPIYALVGIGLLLGMEAKQEFIPAAFHLFTNRHEFVRILAFAGLVAVIIALGVFDGGQFIYARF